MPEKVADPPSPSCYHLFSGTGIKEFQRLSPDPFSPRGRDARGRFAKGSSGNPRGRPPGIRNPRRRVPDLASRPLSAQALSDLLDRKPHLLGRSRRNYCRRLLPSTRRSVSGSTCVVADGRGLPAHAGRRSGGCCARSGGRRPASACPVARRRTPGAVLVF